MGRSLEEIDVATHVAEVINHGEKIILPEDMGLDSAINVLRRRKKHLQTEVEFSEDFNVFPWDGAYGLSKVLVEQYGWVEGRPIVSLFGQQKPRVIKLAIGPNETADVAWGNFALPGDIALLSTGVSHDRNGSLIFRLTASTLRIHEPTVRELFTKLRDYLRTNSIYRGKAIKIRFRDDDGSRVEMPQPEFIDTSTIHPENLIFSKDLMASINGNLFTPITRVNDCIQNGIKVKRGVLLGGPYGTGKTLAASVAARLAVDAGITYVYSPRASELSDAIDFARQYQSPACVVFCEDIDRQITGERSVKMDDVLNILDGVDTKGANLITVLTTNHLENINQAMLRPGRLDAIINVAPPDAEAAERLVRMYGGDSIVPTEDLTEVGRSLAGQIPAVIEETVKRAKLFQLALIGEGHAITGLTSEALRQAGVTMGAQIELLKPKEPEKPDSVGTAIQRVVEAALEDHY